MLKHRIITALIMGILFLGVLFLPAPQMVFIFSLVVVVAAWEWAQLAGFAGRQKVAYALVVGLLLFAMAATVSFDAFIDFLHYSCGCFYRYWRLFQWPNFW